MGKPQDYYKYPTQVMFGVMDDGATDHPRQVGGIAFHDYIICAECGEAIPLYLFDSRFGFKELSWIDISEAVVGDETPDEDWESIEGQEELKNLVNDIKKADSNSQEISDHVNYVKATFFTHQDNAMHGSVCTYVFPAHYNDYMIENEIQEHYIDWATETWKDIVPEAELIRFKEMLEQFGIPQEDYKWEYTNRSEYLKYSR